MRIATSVSGVQRHHSGRWTEGAVIDSIPVMCPLSILECRLPKLDVEGSSPVSRSKVLFSRLQPIFLIGEIPRLRKTTKWGFQRY